MIDFINKMNKKKFFFENNHLYYKININYYKNFNYFLKFIYLKYNIFIFYIKLS